MKTNKNSKEKEIKMNKIIHLLSISEFESNRYNVEIFNHQVFKNMIRSNANLIWLKDLNLFNQQIKSVLTETSRSNQKSSSFFSKIVKQKTSTSKKLRFLSTFRASHDINSKLDWSNILSEKVKRKRIKKQTHAIFLEKI